MCPSYVIKEGRSEQRDDSRIEMGYDQMENQDSGQ